MYKHVCNIPMGGEDFCDLGFILKIIFGLCARFGHLWFMFKVI